MQDVTLYGADEALHVNLGPWGEHNFFGTAEPDRSRRVQDQALSTGRGGSNTMPTQSMRTENFPKTNTSSVP